jgi:hypothetical protein
LLANTPPDSLSNARVQKALDIIERVAELCDQAAHIYGEQ